MKKYIITVDDLRDAEAGFHETKNWIGCKNFVSKKKRTILQSIGGIKFAKDASDNAIVKLFEDAELVKVDRSFSSGAGYFESKPGVMMKYGKAFFLDENDTILFTANNDYVRLFVADIDNADIPLYMSEKKGFVTDGLTPETTTFIVTGLRE